MVCGNSKRNAGMGCTRGHTDKTAATAPNATGEGCRAGNKVHSSFTAGALKAYVGRGVPVE